MAPPVGRVTLIRDGDGLEDGDAAGGQQPVELFEKGAVVAVTHRFEHLDGNDLVKAAAQVEAEE